MLISVLVHECKRSVETSSVVIQVVRILNQEAKSHQGWLKVLVQPLWTVPPKEEAWNCEQGIEHRRVLHN